MIPNVIPIEKKIWETAVVYVYEQTLEMTSEHIYRVQSQYDYGSQLTLGPDLWPVDKNTPIT